MIDSAFKLNIFLSLACFFSHNEAAFLKKTKKGQIDHHVTLPLILKRKYFQLTFLKAAVLFDFFQPFYFAFIVYFALVFFLYLFCIALGRKPFNHGAHASFDKHVCAFRDFLKHTKETNQFLYP